MNKLLIVSTGRCVWDDLDKIGSLEGYDVMAINHMIMYWPGHLDYAVSWHPDCLKAWTEIRSYRRQKNRPKTFGPKQHEGVDEVGRFCDGDLATSGMYSVHVGLHLGYGKIVIAGMPFDGTGHFYDNPNKPVTCQKYKYEAVAKSCWCKLNNKAGDKVKAVSGNLIGCFGELTEEWLIKE